MCAALKRRDFEVLCGNMSDVSRKYVKTIVPDAVIIRVDQRTTHLLRSALMNMSEKNGLSSDLPKFVWATCRLPTPLRQLATAAGIQVLKNNAGYAGLARAIIAAIDRAPW
jgi:hypothetical protein